MNIIMGSDHGGFKLKEEIKTFLINLDHTIEDVGCYSSEAIDYPDIADTVMRKYIEHDYEFGILFCGTGIGMSIAVNRSRQIRAALCHDEYTARLSREHNDANILCLGERVTGVGVALEIVKTFIETQFAGGRHQRRVDMFSE